MNLQKKHAGILIAFLLFSILLSGCSLFRGGDESDDMLSLFLVMDKSVYRPNEPVIITVHLQNLSENNLNIHNLDARSLNFYKEVESTGEVLEVMPVFSKDEPLLRITKLEALGSLDRKFLFTSLTKNRGRFTLQASYNIGPVGQKYNIPDIISEAHQFSVTGGPPYVRDVKGILKKEDAVSIAEQWLGQPVEKTTARLVINEAGFYDWWITMTLQGKTGSEGEPLRKACFVNPYLAVVRKEAKPYDPPPGKKEAPVRFRKKSKMDENLESPIPLPDINPTQ